MFNKNSNAIIYGLQLKAAQQMLDFDFLCGREPSVLAFINEGKKQSSHKIFFGDKEIIIPSYPDFSSLPESITDKIDTLVNFASFRSAGDATKAAMKSGYFTNIAIIAEGIPERESREIIALNKELNLNIIGPATVGAMTAGAFRAGNTGGALENIISSQLYRPGDVGFVSKSGGMSNELRRVIADRTSGTKHSIALGGDRYNVMQFSDAMKIMENDDDISMIVMLGEVGGRDELEVAKMISNKQITKPVVAWCIGTIGEQISGEVQFGHAGAKSNHDEETASFKNNALKQAGATVPESYMDFGDKIEEVYNNIVGAQPCVRPDKDNVGAHNCIQPDENNVGAPLVGTQNGNNNTGGQTQGTAPTDGNNQNRVPTRGTPTYNYENMNIEKKLLQINNRKKTLFTSTISDERGEELTYNKKPISEYAQTGSFANVIGNLWLKRDLPKYAQEFINTILILLADHGPAVSGATNAIVTARAGNDLKSSLISGLTTIGPRFGGAIDGAAKYFSQAVNDDITANDFVVSMRKAGINIPGIGHKVKSKFNPDKRCEILLELANGFPSREHLDFALAVESLTLEKKSNLILNVDGMIAAMLLDVFKDIGMSYEEIQDYIEAGIFNAFFILARTTGFIGHIIDQKRLKEPLARTPWDDILYN